MAGRIRDEDIAAIRERVKIEDVVKEFVTLKSAGGGSLKGLCPFHEERSPSFHVTPSRGYYHCLAGSTGVITKDGVVPVRQLADAGYGTVLDGAGEWVTVPFYSYGVQPLMRVGLMRRSNGWVYQVFATGEHRWFITVNGEHVERVTGTLRKGDELTSVLPHGVQGEPWVVTGVEETDRVEEVFCAVVESTRSFVLEGNLLTGNCFGCGEGGDIFAFLQNVEHIGFIDAVEILAERAGLELQYLDGVPGERVEKSVRMRLLAAHAEAAEFYRKQMLTAEAQTGVKFLSDRGFDFEMAGRFSVGYAPKGWDNLAVYLKDKGFSEDELITGGLVTKREGSNGVYDKFRGRLIWPIKNASGEVIGFGARKLYDDQGPKYLNTSETPLYKKSQVLYGIDLARKEIAARRQAVIVEGYTDVMACHLAGIPTAVAACGTAFGGEHIGVLRRILRDDDKMKGEVIFTFDGDAAGQKAALRAFEEDQRFVARTFVAVEPNGMDPCEVRMARGDEGVRKLLADRVPLFEFAIKSMLAGYDVSTPEGRVAGLKQAAPVVAAIKDPTLRPEYTRLLSGWLGLDVGMVRRAVNAAGSAAARDESAVEKAAAAGRPAPSVTPTEWVVEREALKCVMQFPVESSEWFNAVEGSAWTNPVYRNVFDAVFRADPATGNGGSGWVEAVLRETNGDDHAAHTVRELVVEPLMSESPEYINSAIAQVIEMDASRRIADLKARLVQATGDKDTQSQLMRELMEMDTYRRDILRTVHGTV